jgi:hypothetical protein
MIRDPSDGSIREKPVGAKNAHTEKPTPGPVPGMTSALPIMGDPKEIERLNRSRLWLKQYQGRGK